jgi:hypothetical protein
MKYDIAHELLFIIYAVLLQESDSLKSWTEMGMAKSL